MNKRNIGLLAAVAAMAIGPSGIAMARNGADDPVPHARGGADDGVVHKAAHHRRHHSSVLERRGRGSDDVQPHFRRGADDPAGDQRHGGGADDPAGHR